MKNELGVEIMGKLLFQLIIPSVHKILYWELKLNFNSIASRLKEETEFVENMMLIKQKKILPEVLYKSQNNTKITTKI